jgi:N-acetylglucosamine repressor
MFDAGSAVQRERMNAILRLVLERTRVTRAGLAEGLRLSPSSIIKYSKTLIDRGLLRESDQEESTGGRRSVLLELNPQAGLMVTVALNASSFNGALLDLAGTTLGEETAPCRQGTSREELLAALAGLIERLLARAAPFHRRILGIGIGLGGYIDPFRGISHEYLYARDWYDVPLRQIVEERFLLPCFLVNDANSCALAEKYFGMGVGISHFLCVMIGEGIGMGIVANGELYTGASSYAGEFGHVHAVDDGALCFCGHTGCLETVCSQQAILSACCAGLRQGVNSQILKHCGGDSEHITIDHVIAAANDGDRFARNIMSQAGDAIGVKLSDVADLFNPELIILRGPVIDGNQFLYERIRGIVTDQSLRPTSRALRIAYSPERKDIRFAGIGSAILMDYFSRSDGAA